MKDTPTFSAQFDDYVRARQATLPHFASLAQIHGPAACQAAIELAVAYRFLDSLAQGLAVAIGPYAAERLASFGTVNAIAIQQGIVNAATGLADTSVFFALHQVSRALCLVRSTRRAIGTAFLIGDDLVLTAAHVIENAGYTADGAGDASLQKKIDFVFTNSDLPPSEREVRLARDWVVSYSPSCIRPDSDDVIPPHAASALDFILMRLDTSVTASIPRLKLDNLGSLPKQMTKDEMQRRYFIVGYPGCSDSKYDTGNITGIDEPGARILHLCNSTGGMSGSPLLDENAAVIGLHEGSIEKPVGVLLHNRATMLRSIASAIATDDTKRETARQLALQPVPVAATAVPQAPMQATSGPPPRAPMFVTSAETRRNWARYGQKLGVDLQLAADWKACLAAAGVNGDGSSIADVSDRYYPIFPFHALQEWLDAPAADTEKYNVRMIEGAPGTGTSFALDYAAARDAGSGILRVEAGVSSSLELADMLAALHPSGEFDDHVRPFDGRLRNTYIPRILDYFDTLAERKRARQLVVAVELDREGSYWSQSATFWKLVAILIADRSKLRLLLCSPSEQLRDELNAEGIANIVCPIIERTTLLHHCQALAEHMAPARTAEALAECSRLWDALRPGNADARFATCDAARILIQVRRTLLIQRSQPC